MSAPASMSAFAASALFSAAAHIRAVCPFQPSFALTVAPCASSALIAGTLPVRAAVISAVSPSGSAVLGSAPAASSFSMTAALPLTHARYSGVTPYRVVALTLAPARSRTSTLSASLRSTATCSGVVPSVSALLISAAFLASDRTAVLSPFFSALEQRRLGTGRADTEHRQDGHRRDPTASHPHRRSPPFPARSRVRDPNHEHTAAIESMPS